MKIKKPPKQDSTAAAKTKYAPKEKQPPKRVGKIPTGLALVVLLISLACTSVSAFLVYTNWAYLSQF